MLRRSAAAADTRTTHDSESAHRNRTKHLLWAMLVSATVTSMAGNIAHAWSHQGAVSVSGAVAAAAVPPLALLSLTHLAGMWSRISARGVVYWCFLIAVAAITAAAFRLSFDALRSLAVQYGYSRADAALFPLILDGLVAVCTLGLVVLARTTDPPAGSSVVHRRGESGGAPGSQPEDSCTTVSDADAVHPSRISRRGGGDSRDALLDARDVTQRRSGSGPVTDASGRNSDDAHSSPVAVPAPGRGAPPDADLETDGDTAMQLAHRLVSSGRTTAPLESVYRVLVRTATGVASRPVAAEVGLSYSTVQRIVRAARDMHQLAQG